VEIKEELSFIETLEEANELPPDLSVSKTEISVELMKIYANEELLWYQKAHEKWLMEGDLNTSYFHRVANGRKRKNTMFSLNDNGVNIEGTDKLIEHATSYYKKLFGPAGSIFPYQS
jgi:mannosylglycoprotein endo-beta-mannosidase